MEFARKLINGGYQIRASWLEKVQKINKWSGHLFDSLEYAQRFTKGANAHLPVPTKKPKI